MHEIRLTRACLVRTRAYYWTWARAVRVKVSRDSEELARSAVSAASMVALPARQRWDRVEYVESADYHEPMPHLCGEEPRSAACIDLLLSLLRYDVAARGAVAPDRHRWFREGAFSTTP